MKKILLSMLAISAFHSVSIAQSEGGLPWSYNYHNTGYSVNSSLTSFAPLNMETIEEEDLADQVSMVAKPMRVAINLATDLNLNNAGKFTFLDNGNIIWSAQVEVPGAIALEVYFNQFDLPKGAQLFFFNENRRQIDGAYTDASENEYSSFRSDFVQGDKINIELNLPAGTDLNDVKFNINQIGANYRGGIAMDIAQYYGAAEGENLRGKITPDGTDDPCYRNANCGEFGTTYAFMKNTAVHYNIGGYICSGNMINNTNNDCTPLFYTASHCEASNSFKDATYANWKFYFNYESPGCSGGVAPRTQTATGAYFVARSENPFGGAATGPLKADHLLLKLRAPTSLLATYKVNLGGWERNGLIKANEKWITYHHPGGIRKKVSLAKTITGDGTFNQNTVPNTHWSTTWEIPGTQGGSSGSALFERSTGRIIGTLSGGPPMPGDGDCENMKVGNALYAKLSRAWTNTAGDGGASDSTSLNLHLDSANTGASFTNTVAINTSKKCEINLNPVSVTKINTLELGIQVFPNPTNGKVSLTTNFKNYTDLNIQVVNVLGQIVKTLEVKEAKNNEFVIDLTEYSNGMYIINVSNGELKASKKILLNK